MCLELSTLILALGAPPPGTQPNPTGEMIKLVMLMALFLIVIYMISIRPQQKKAKEHAALIKTLRPGDKVLTSGGIVGVVVTVREKTVSIRSADTKLEILKSAVSEITERSGESSAS